MANYANRLNKIKAFFKKNYDEANSLVSMINQDIEEKENEKASIQAEINSMTSTKVETEKFIENLSKFI